LDLACGGNSLMQVDMVENLGNGVFAAPIALSTTQNFSQLRLVDLDGGLPEIVLNYGKKIAIRSNLSGFAFGPEQITAFAGFGHDMQIADVDLDGRKDVLLSDDNYNCLIVLRGDPTTATGFQAQHFGTVPKPTGIALGDFDGDGRPDLAVGSSQTVSPLAVLLNQQ
jgi:hypothetical protein